MNSRPDAAIAEMAAELADGTQASRGGLGGAQSPAKGAARPKQPTAPPEPRAASSTATGKPMSALVAVDDLREIAAKRELYRRLARTSDDLREVAERVWYSVLKES